MFVSLGLHVLHVRRVCCSVCQGEGTSVYLAHVVLCVCMRTCVHVREQVPAAWPRVAVCGVRQHSSHAWLAAAGARLLTERARRVNKGPAAACIGGWVSVCARACTLSAACTLAALVLCRWVWVWCSRMHSGVHVWRGQVAGLERVAAARLWSCELWAPDERQLQAWCKRQALWMGMGGALGPCRAATGGAPALRVTQRTQL